jgi:hypothetical protein
MGKKTGKSAFVLGYLLMERFHVPAGIYFSPSSLFVIIDSGKMIPGTAYSGSRVFFARETSYVDLSISFRKAISLSSFDGLAFNSPFVIFMHRFNNHFFILKRNDNDKKREKYGIPYKQACRCYLRFTELRTFFQHRIKCFAQDCL